MRRGIAGAALWMALVSLGACGHGRDRGVTADGDVAPKKQKRRKRTPLMGERIAVLALENRVEADASVADVPVTVPPSQPNADSGQPGVTPEKNPGNLELLAPLTRAWEAGIGVGASRTRRLTAPPAVAGGRVFTIDTEANVRAFDMASGRPLWSRGIAHGRIKRSVAFGGGVSAEGDAAYATSGYGIVQAYAAADGKPLWRTELGVPLRNAPAVGAERLFLIGQDGTMFALDRRTGAKVWDQPTTSELASLLGNSTPAISGGTVVAGFASGELTAFLTTNGRTVWQDALARTGRSTAIASLADIDASPVIDRDRVFAIGHGGRMVALELTTGTRAWERNFAGLSMPWVAGDWVFAVTLKGELVALTRAEGKVRWITQLPQFVKAKKKKGDIRWYGPVLASDRLWLVGSQGRVGWVDPATGKLGDTWELPDETYLPPVIAGGMLFALTEKGRLVAFRGASAAAAPAVPAPPAGAADIITTPQAAPDIVTTPQSTEPPLLSAPPPQHR